MKPHGRLLDAGLAAAALTLLVLLLYPARPAPLPAAPQRPGEAQPAQQPAAPAPAVSRPFAEVAALFTAARPAAAQPLVKPATPPQPAAWLHFIAFVVGSTGQTTYFFKNDQTGRVLMLACQQPRDGWNLAVVQADAWVLENDAHRYLVTR